MRCGHQPRVQGMARVWVGWVSGWAPPGMVPPVFTDFTFDNLGVPKSDHPLLVTNPVDVGLGAVVGDEAENGKFKVMTLRNIGLTAPYAHNGYFEALKDITHFYNTRDGRSEGLAAARVFVYCQFWRAGQPGAWRQGRKRPGRIYEHAERQVLGRRLVRSSVLRQRDFPGVGVV